ncbi:MAG: RCC1 domain-containing protein [Angustibacter sp.]
MFNWQEVVTGLGHTCGIRSTGSLWCWGSNSTGELGNSNQARRDEPTRVGNDNDWATVSAGGFHTCATRTDGSLWCWGYNGWGQLGDGTTINRNRPVQVGSGTSWATVSTGDLHTCATRTDGSLWCWGPGGGGRLGTGALTNHTSPTLVAGGNSGWSTVSAGNVHTCGIRTDGELRCWGANAVGRLGDGTVGVNRLSPTPVDGGGTWNAVSTGRDHTCAIRGNNTLWCWGSQQSGQLGDGVVATSNRSSPYQVSATTTWTSVASGDYSTCARRNDSSLWCWGDNSYGQLGDDTTVSRAVPGPVAGAGSWASTGGGGFTHTCAVQSDRTAWCWGENAEGQLGDNTTTNRLVPTLVGTIP